MPARKPLSLRAAEALGITVLGAALVVALCAVASAQDSGTLIARAVGGIAVDASGMLEDAAVDVMGQLSRQRAEALEQIPGELNQAAPLRKLSLRRLEAAVEESVRDGKQLPDQIKYLAGLQQVHYVFVYPEQKDIVLVGPGEGWKIDQRGNVVGINTGRAVMLLDDLLVALRTARQAANGGITCSINPTPEGLVRYASFTEQFGRTGDPTAFAAGAERAMGPQKISLTNVPATSHFARVLVAADYRMKRLGMGFEEAPVRGLPSYLQMARNTRNAMPRWWLEPKYEPLLKSPDGLAWELRGGSVKAMTEDEFLTASGGVQRAANTDAMSQKWADNMTEHFDELAMAMPVFGQLRNCMELAIVGALVVKERLPEKAGYAMPTLLDSARVKLSELPAPGQVATKVSMVSRSGNWIISASGGVALNSWAVADKVQQSEAPAAVRAEAAPTAGSNWWWN